MGLYDAGYLSEAEFTAAKQRLIAPSTPVLDARRPARDCRSLKTWLVGGLTLAAGSALGVAAYAVATATFLDDYLATGDASAYQVAISIEDGLAMWRGVDLAVRVVVAGLFIAWLWAVRRMLEEVQPDPWVWSRWWAIFGWVVPIAFLFVPYWFVDEVAYRTGERPRGLLVAWWLTFVAAGIFGVGAEPYLQSGGDPFNYFVLIATAGATSLVAAVLAIALVRRITDAAHEAAAATAADPAGLADSSQG